MLKYGLSCVKTGVLTACEWRGLLAYIRVGAHIHTHGYGASVLGTLCITCLGSYMSIQTKVSSTKMQLNVENLIVNSGLWPRGFKNWMNALKLVSVEMTAIKLLTF